MLEPTSTCGPLVSCANAARASSTQRPSVHSSNRPSDWPWPEWSKRRQARPRSRAQAASAAAFVPVMSDLSPLNQTTPAFPESAGSRR